MACSGGGATIGAGGGGGPNVTSTPAPGATPTSAVTGSAAPNVAYTKPPGLDADAPPLATTSAQTWGLTCAPSYVVSAGGISSCNMRWVAHIPVPPGSIGGHYVPALHAYFVTGYTHGLYALDVSDPEHVTVEGSLNVDLGMPQNGVLISEIENEDPPANARFVLLSNRQYQTMTVVDVHDPKNMSVVATVAGGEGHTIDCIALGTNDCAYAYTAWQPASRHGNIVDMRDPVHPALIGQWEQLINGVYSHDLNEVHPGLLAAASNPVAFIDTTDPAHPSLIFTLQTDAAEPQPIDVGPPQSGHTGHSVIWPREGQDDFFLGQDEGIYDGRCEEFPDDGRTLYAYNTLGWQGLHRFSLEGSYTLVTGNGDLGATSGAADGVDSNGEPSNFQAGFLSCSTHWFDPHPYFNNGGLIAQAAFAFGVRVLNVAPSGQIQQIGWFVPPGLGNAGADTSSAHWIAPRYLAVEDFQEGGIDIVEYLGPLPASGPLTGLSITHQT